jgi:3-oxoacid CoA-transferase subunit B
VIDKFRADVMSVLDAVPSGASLATRARYWVVMEHVDRAGRPKIVEECTFPLTGRRVVTRGQLRLKECAPGVRPEAVRDRTAASHAEDFSA